MPSPFHSRFLLSLIILSPVNYKFTFSVRLFWPEEAFVRDNNDTVERWGGMFMQLRYHYRYFCLNKWMAPGVACSSFIFQTTYYSWISIYNSLNTSELPYTCKCYCVYQVQCILDEIKPCFSCSFIWSKSSVKAINMLMSDVKVLLASVQTCYYSSAKNRKMIF